MVPLMGQLDLWEELEKEKEQKEKEQKKVVYVGNQAGRLQRREEAHRLRAPLEWEPVDSESVLILGFLLGINENGEGSQWEL